MSIKDVVRLIEESEARFVDLRLTGTKGGQYHLTVPARIVLNDPEEWFENGQVLDDSFVGGRKGIQTSDMQLRSDASTAFVDPFCDGTTVVFTCDVIDPDDGQGHGRDPHSTARRAEVYLKFSGIGDTAYFGPEPEFFVFDGAEFETDTYKTRYEITSESGAWPSDLHLGSQNIGHRPAVKGGYAPVAPIDYGQDLRSTMMNILEEFSIEVKVHHSEVGIGSQMEIGTRFATLAKRAD